MAAKTNQANTKPKDEPKAEEPKKPKEDEKTKEPVTDKVKVEVTARRLRTNVTGEDVRFNRGDVFEVDTKYLKKLGKSVKISGE